MAVERFTTANHLASDKQPRRIIQAALAMEQQHDAEFASRLLELVDGEPDKLDPQTQTLYHRLSAVIAERQGQYEEAIKAWKRLLELDPLYGVAMLKLCDLYVQTGQRDRAYLVTERALRIESVRLEALLRHAKLLVEDKRFSQALSPLAEALEIKPSEGLQNLYRRVRQASDDTRSG